MLRSIAFAAGMFFYCAAMAQVNYSVLNFQQNRLSIHPNGTMFNLPDSGHLHEYPAGSGNHLLGFSGLWIAAKDNSGSLHTSVASGNASGDEFWPGPIDTLTGLAKDPDDWNKVWIVTKSAIDSHMNDWNKTGYEMPAAISEWPARHADTNIKPHMAPYADANINGIYDPENGDYPLIKGDMAAYFIANDAFGEHTVSGGLKLNIELHGMSYVFVSGKDTNVLFNEYYFVNRSPVDYDTVLIGFFNDVVLGYEFDNYIGSLVDLRTVYAYNGDNDDEGFYGNGQPVAGLVGLDAPLWASMAFNGSQDVSRSIPTVHQQFWRAANAHWNDGQPLTFGGTGRNIGNPVTRWIYPGDTDPLNTGSWSDEDAEDFPGKRNFLAVYGPFKLNAGSYIKVSSALLWQTNFELETFRNRISALITDHGTPLSTPVVVSEMTTMWPNPATSGEKIYFDKKVTEVEIWDINGRLVQSYKKDKKSETECSVFAVQGVYWVKATFNDSFTWMKLVIQ